MDLCFRKKFLMTELRLEWALSCCLYSPWPRQLGKTQNSWSRSQLRAYDSFSCQDSVFCHGSEEACCFLLRFQLHQALLHLVRLSTETSDRQTSPVCHSQTSTSPSSLCFRLLHNRCKHCMCGHWFSSLSPSGNERVCVAISHLRALHPYRAGIQCFLKQCGLCHLPPSHIFLLLSPLLHTPLHSYPGSGSDYHPYVNGLFSSSSLFYVAPTIVFDMVYNNIFMDSPE